MTAFEHVTALFSFVYALALTYLLARIAELVVERDRVRSPDYRKTANGALFFNKI